MVLIPLDLVILPSGSGFPNHHPLSPCVAFLSTLWVLLASHGGSWLGFVGVPSHGHVLLSMAWLISVENLRHLPLSTQLGAAVKCHLCPGLKISIV